MVRKDFDRVASELVLITTYCRSSGRTISVPIWFEFYFKQIASFL